MFSHLLLVYGRYLQEKQGMHGLYYSFPPLPAEQCWAGQEQAWSVQLQAYQRKPASLHVCQHGHSSSTGVLQTPPCLSCVDCRQREGLSPRLALLSPRRDIQRKALDAELPSQRFAVMHHQMQMHWWLHQMQPLPCVSLLFLTRNDCKCSA